MANFLLNPHVECWKKLYWQKHISVTETNFCHRKMGSVTEISFIQIIKFLSQKEDYVIKQDSVTELSFCDRNNILSQK